MEHAGVNATGLFCWRRGLTIQRFVTTIGTDESWEFWPTLRSSKPTRPFSHHARACGSGESTVSVTIQKRPPISPAFVQTNDQRKRGQSRSPFNSIAPGAGWLGNRCFNDSSWAFAKTVDRSAYQLFAQVAPMENEQAELKAGECDVHERSLAGGFWACIDGWPNSRCARTIQATLCVWNIFK